MIRIFSTKNFYLLILIVSIFSLLSAIYIEHILEVRPCTLCLYQRIPYLISIFICFFGFNYPNNLFYIFSLILIFILSSMLSGYHVGIENNLFKEFSGCTSGNLNILNKYDLLKNLKDTMPSCKEVNFKFSGFSLATINLVISIVITFLSIKYLINAKNK